MSNIHLELLHLAQDMTSDANPSYLLSQGANPNFRDIENHRWTPLLHAVCRNKENFALQLLQHKRTNALLVDSDGFSALYWAAKKSTSRVISALLNKGCDPNERDMRGMTALFAAVSGNKIENVRILLSHPRINVDQVNQFGGSALHHCACTTDNVEIAQLLVGADADLFLSDKEGQCPIHVAKKQQRKRLFAYFKQEMLAKDASYKCTLTFSEETPAKKIQNGWDSATETSEDEQKNNANNEHSNSSVHSVAFSVQSSNNSVDNNEASLLQQPQQNESKSAPTKPLKNKKNKMRSPALQTSQSLNMRYSHIMLAGDHQSTMKQLQENKLKIALKIDSSSGSLSKAARELLQEQQYHFQYEQEVFYSSVQNKFSSFQREIDCLRAALNKTKQGNNELIKQNYKLNLALANQQKRRRPHSSNKVNVAGKISKYKKEFRRWFKKEIGCEYLGYYECFVRNGFDDLRVIKHITNELQLKEIGIDKQGHRLRILGQIKQYNDGHNIALPAFQHCVGGPINQSFNSNDIDAAEGWAKTN